MDLVLFFCRQLFSFTISFQNNLPFICCINFLLKFFFNIIYFNCVFFTSSTARSPIYGIDLAYFDWCNMIFQRSWTFASLMAKDVEHLFVSQPFVFCLLCSFILYFKNWAICIFKVNFLNSLYILDTSPLSNILLVKIFSHSLDCHLD